MDDPQTWIAVAESFGCRVYAYHAPGGCPGEYAPAGEGQGVICYNDACTPPTRAKVILHELVHHLMCPLISGFLFGEYHRCGYDDDALDCRHRIAQAVQDICFRRL